MKFNASVGMILALVACAVPLHAQSQFTPMSQGMNIEQKLGAKIAANVPFLDEQGKPVTIGTYLGKEPVLVVPVFYSCQTGCAMITDGLVQTLMKANQPTGMVGVMERQKGQMPLTPGRDLEIVMVGINPKETPALAANKKNLILDTMDTRSKSGLSRMLSSGSSNLADEMQAHFHLLTGSLENIRKVTDSIGFTYAYNPATDVIRHPTGSVVLTPAGVISSYTIGNDFPTKMLESSLETASRNEVSVHKADQSFMFGCVMIDPATGHIRWVVENVVRVACVFTLLIFGFGFFRMLRNERTLTTSAGGDLGGASRFN